MDFESFSFASPVRSGSYIQNEERGFQYDHRTEGVLAGHSHELEIVKRSIPLSESHAGVALVLKMDTPPLSVSFSQRQIRSAILRL